MLALPHVTLVIAETRAHALAARTINDLVGRVQFGDILIYSNDCAAIPVPGARYITVQDWPNKIASGQFYYSEAATRIETSHALLMEWDAGLNEPEAWTDDFLQYDFIGAPWPGRGHSHVKDGMNVGNGGFMLQSKRLADFLFANQKRIVCATDFHLACHHRRQIEREGGFKWAHESVAERFAFEGWNYGYAVPGVKPKSFGYHGCFNWELMLGREETLARTRMLVDNQFTRNSKLDFLLRTSGSWLSQHFKPLKPINSMERMRQERARHQRLQIGQHPGRGLKA